jgi:hypothetical protein
MPHRLGPVMILASLSLGACGNEWVSATGQFDEQFEELCGKQAPVRLLALEVDQVPTGVNARKFADRYVFALRSGDSDDQTVEVWSTGECGEDPVRLIDGVVYSIEGGYPPWPDVPFVCERSSGRLLALDPRGLRPPHEPLATRECSAHSPTAHGLVSILGEGDTGPLVLQRWPSDPLSEVAEQIVLVDEVKARPSPLPQSSHDERGVLKVVGDEVFAITAADELVVVSLEDLGVEILAEGVRELAVGPSGRHVLWQGVEILNDDPLWPEGPIFLLDRQSGQATKIDETALAYAPNTYGRLELEPLGVVHYRVGALNDATADRWLRLDTLEPIDVPGLVWAWWPIDDTRAVFGRLGSYSPLYLFDASTAELTPLYDGPSNWKSPRPTGIWIMKDIGDELFEVSFTGERRTLARHVVPRYGPLSGDRIVTPHAVGEDGIGSLIVVDSKTLDDRHLDHDVLAISTGVVEWPDGGDLVTYMVVDADPERHGIWLAKPAR